MGCSTGSCGGKAKAIFAQAMLDPTAARMLGPSTGQIKRLGRAVPRGTYVPPRTAAEFFQLAQEALNQGRSDAIVRSLYAQYAALATAEGADLVPLEIFGGIWTPTNRDEIDENVLGQTDNVFDYGVLSRPGSAQVLTTPAKKVVRGFQGEFANGMWGLCASPETCQANGRAVDPVWIWRLDQLDASDVRAKAPGLVYVNLYGPEGLIRSAWVPAGAVRKYDGTVVTDPKYVTGNNANTGFAMGTQTGQMPAPGAPIKRLSRVGTGPQPERSASELREAAARIRGAADAATGQIRRLRRRMPVYEAVVGPGVPGPTGPGPMPVDQVFDYGVLAPSTGQIILRGARRPLPTIRVRSRAPYAVVCTYDRRSCTRIRPGVELVAAAAAPDGTSYPWDRARPERGNIAYVVFPNGTRGWMAPDQFVPVTDGAATGQIQLRRRVGGPSGLQAPRTSDEILTLVRNAIAERRSGAIIRALHAQYQAQALAEGKLATSLPDLGYGNSPIVLTFDEQDRVFDYGVLSRPAGPPGGGPLRSTALRAVIARGTTGPIEKKLWDRIATDAGTQGVLAAIAALTGGGIIAVADAYNALFALVVSDDKVQGEPRATLFTTGPLGAIPLSIGTPLVVISERPVGAVPGLSYVRWQQSPAQPAVDGWMAREAWTYA